MSRKLQVAFPLFILSGALSFCPLRAVAQSTEPAITRLCTPKITADIVVASPQQRYDAGQRSQPPITDTYSGFAWPDTPMGVLKTDNGYEFFASDGGSHTRQMWRGEWVGNNKSGSVVTTFGTLANPLGTGDPQNVSISQNPDPAVNPDYPSYGYMGGGPVFRVPADMPGAGNLLVVYHAELPNDALYAALGLAESTDHGLHWTDLGEIIRLNQAYAVGLDGFEIGDGPLVLSPDRKYFYLYFPDWLANGTLHTTTPAGASTTTNVSVARALVSSVLDAAFASPPRRPLPEVLSGRLASATRNRRCVHRPQPNIRLPGISRYPLQRRNPALHNDHFKRHHVRVLRIREWSQLDFACSARSVWTHRSLSHSSGTWRRSSRARQHVLRVLHSSAQRGLARGRAAAAHA